MKRCARALSLALVIAAAFPHVIRRVQAATPAASVCGTDMRVLVISADGTEADLPAITTTLDYLGTPYTVHVATQTPGTLTADALASGCHANYQAVIVTTGAVDNIWSGVLSATELQALHTFEVQFHAREVVWYTFPNDFGLTFTGKTVNTIGQPPLTVSLTTAGTAVFPYINLGPQRVIVGGKTVTIGNPAKPLIVEQAAAYLAQPDPAASTTPIIQDTAGNTLATITNTPDGREILALTFDSNAYSLQTLLFGYGLVNWVNRGVFVGERHVYMSPQVDDVFIEDDEWVNGTSCALVGHDLNVNGTGPVVRMTGNDLLTVLAWQSARNAQPTTANLRLTLAMNGWGTTGVYHKDTLTKTAQTVSPSFYWISHTYDHPTLDGIGYAAAKAEFTMNNDVAKRLKLANYSSTSIVTPSISGLKDAQVMQAALDAGIKYLVTDTSVAGEDNPAPNVGIYNWLQPTIFMIPRRPVNLFYNVATPADWTSEYNCLYHSFFGRDLAYSEILDFVSSQLLPYLLHGETDPWMFHQPNLIAYDGRHTLLTDLFDATLAKYNGYFTLPVVSPSMDELGKRVRARTNRYYANVTATLQADHSVVLTSDAAVTVPVTGLGVSGAESYGGQTIAQIAVQAGQIVIVNPPPVGQPPSAPSTPSPASGASNVALTTTLTWSATNATAFDVKFGTANPPPQVVSGQPGASYTPALTAGTTYFWQVVARNSGGATSSPIWSFSTVPVKHTEVVIYASDIALAALHGSWTATTDAGSPNGVKLATPDNGWSSTESPLATPTDYIDVSFTADANTSYALWLRIKAVNNNKYNDSLWVQFFDAQASGAAVYPVGTTSGLLVNLATDAGALSLNNWGWQQGAYWLSQPTVVTFATTGAHQMRIQVREDGVQLDQIVLSSARFLTVAPGSVTNDTTIVPKS